jgi:hypothetical protein
MLLSNRNAMKEFLLVEYAYDQNLVDPQQFRR